MCIKNFIAVKQYLHPNVNQLINFFLLIISLLSA
jgi:hypothetical protein